MDITEDAGKSNERLIGRLTGYWARGRMLEGTLLSNYPDVFAFSNTPALSNILKTFLSQVDAIFNFTLDCSLPCGHELSGKVRAHCARASLWLSGSCEGNVPHHLGARQRPHISCSSQRYGMVPVLARIVPNTGKVMFSLSVPHHLRAR